jgi:nicotinic acid mononucleotide adenylyltransferase
MQFFRKATGHPSRLAILPGAFHPPTVAHMALARAALRVAGEVLFVLPQSFPHKAYEGAPFERRLEWLMLATASEARCSIAATDRGLFIDIARACRAAYGEGVRLSFLCGTDAAERIVGWDYGDREKIADQWKEYDLLVADRAGAYRPPRQYAAHIEALPLDGDYHEISATEVRSRISAGLDWESLTPPEIVESVRDFFARTQVR